MTEPTPRGAWLRDRLVNVLLLFGLVAAGLTLVAFGAPLWWPFDLMSHFRAQYFLGLLVIGVAAWVLRRRRFAFVFLASSVVNLAFLLPFYLPPAGGRPATATATPGAAVPCRFMVMNVRAKSTAHERVAEEIRRVDADVLVLIEVNDRWLGALEDVTAAYPHATVRPRQGCFGIAVYSRHPMIGPVEDIGTANRPSIVARLDVDGHPMTVIGTHPATPVGPRGSRRRNTQIQALAEHVAAIDGPVMVLGDLNATPFCAPFRSLLRVSGLRDGSRGHGLNATWPAPLPPLAIPIDQCLHSTDIEIVDERVGRRVGSDHLPLIVDARVRASPDGGR